MPDIAGLRRRNKRKKMISLDELMAALREQGVEKVEDVRLANMESEGNLS